MKNKTYLVHSIFVSVSGECGNIPQGAWTVFVRFQGCNLRCSYCDTKKAQKMAGSGCRMSEQDILKAIDRLQAPGLLKLPVLLTGGEPLAQEIAPLIKRLLTLNYSVSVETNGSFRVPFHSHNLTWIVDYKLPGSGQEENMSLSNFGFLSSSDYIKFVCTDKEDFARACFLVDFLQRTNPNTHPSFLFSACSPLRHSVLFDWMRGDRLWKVRLNVQIHKLCTLKE